MKKLRHSKRFPVFLGGAALVLIAAISFYVVAHHGSNSFISLVSPSEGLSEANFVTIPAVASIVMYDGRDSLPSVTTSGAYTGNALWESTATGQLSIENQRNGYYVLAGGLLSSDSDKNELIDTGLRALEWAMNQQGEDGSFPEERQGTDKKESSLHPKTEFLEAAAHALLLIKERGISSAYTSRVSALTDKVEKSMLWVARSQDLTDFLARAKNTNQILFIATGLKDGADLTGNADLETAARRVMDIVLARQLSDGTLPENGGFDMNYQTVSLELLARYAMLEHDPAYKEQLMSALSRGADRFVQQVHADGTIDTAGNTRTIACGARIPGSGPKGKNIDIIPLRLYYLGYVLGRSDVYDPLAAAVETVGQGFDHGAQCTDTADN